MSEAGTLVDVEALIIAHLLADDDVATIADTHVTTELPRDFDADLPWLQITRLPGNFVDNRTKRLERAVLQVQAWGASKEQAFDLIAAATVAIILAVDAPHALGVVTEATAQQTPWWNPDPEADIARYSMSVALYAHPL